MAGRRPEPAEDTFDPYSTTDDDGDVDLFAVVHSPTEVVAENMRGLRRDAGLGQRELAEAMVALRYQRWNRQTVADVEQHNRRVNLDEMFGIAALFGVPVVSLLHTVTGVAIDVRAPGVAILPAPHAQELLLGHGAVAGTGGPQWGAAARAIASGVDVVRPAEQLWAKRRAEGS